MGGTIQHEHGAGWTDARVKLLTSMWNDGSSATEIAAALGGGVTRNGVIGKVSRLKLTRRKATAVRASQALGARGRSGKHRGTAAKANAARAVKNGAGLAFKTSRARSESPDATSTVDALASMRGEDPAGQKLLRSAAWDALPGTTSITLLQLNEHTCKWPIGDAPIMFCGLHPDAGSPYCEQHRRIATGARP